LLALPVLLQVIFLVWGCELCAVILLHCHISQLLLLILFGPQILVRASGPFFLTPLSGNEIIIRAYSSSVSCDDNHRAGAVDSVYDFKDLPSLIFFRHRISNFRHFLHFAANLRSTIDIEQVLWILCMILKIYNHWHFSSQQIFGCKFGILHSRLSSWFHGEFVLKFAMKQKVAIFLESFHIHVSKFELVESFHIQVLKFELILELFLFL
jgi:hypothetical protein